MTDIQNGDINENNQHQIQDSNSNSYELTSEESNSLGQSKKRPLSPQREESDELERDTKIHKTNDSDSTTLPQDSDSSSSTVSSSDSSVKQTKRVDLSRIERLNLEQLKNVTEGDPEFESEILKLYQEELSSSLEKLVQALELKNRKDSTLYSHDLKGSSANIGADAIREIGRVMEEICKDGSLEEAEMYLDQLREEVNEIHSILDKHLNRLASEVKEV